MSEFRYDYGQTVRVSAHAPGAFRPGQLVAVVGMHRIERDDHALQMGHPVGTVLYTIEYDDGSSVQIPEEYIEPERRDTS